MATPHVSGVAALLLSCNTSLTGPQVADIIRQTARALRDNPADPVPNKYYGYGCVDAKAAVIRACPRPVSLPIAACPRPSMVIAVCPSKVVPLCPSSKVIATCQSLPVKCQSSPVICNQVSKIVICPSKQIMCEKPSITVACQSTPVLCTAPSRAFCPSGPVCGGRPPIEGPGDPMAGGDPYGLSGEDWEEYDPYS